eukprot:1136670-Rhodomonas_salina.2
MRGSDPSPPGGWQGCSCGAAGIKWQDVAMHGNCRARQGVSNGGIFVSWHCRDQPLRNFEQQLGPPH